MLREDERRRVHDNLVLPTREPGVTDEVWGSVKTAYEERKAAEAAQGRPRPSTSAQQPPRRVSRPRMTVTSGAPAAETKDNQEVGEVEGLEEEPSEPIVRSLIVLAPAPSGLGRDRQEAGLRLPGAAA